MPDLYALMLAVHLSGHPPLLGLVPGFASYRECVAAAEVTARAMARPPERVVGWACLPIKSVPSVTTGSR